MICPHCEIPIGNLSRQCMKCKTDYIVWEEIRPGDYVFEWSRYRIYCDAANNRAKIQRIYMDIESDTSITYRWYTVLELPTIPDNLSEETIESKIKLYLLFS